MVPNADRTILALTGHSRAENQEGAVRIRKLRIFTVIFVVVVLLAAYGLALLRTYVFKPVPEATSAAFLLPEKSKAGARFS